MTLQFDNFFYSTICHHCKIIPEKLLRCSSCKTVGYCSKEHQKFNWRSHKDLCRAISTSATDFPSSCNVIEWRNRRLGLQSRWSSILCRDLYPYECQMWMFPRVCAYCHSQSNLTDCSECFNVAYCSKQHKADHYSAHKQFCKALQLCLSIDLHLAKTKQYPQVQLKKSYNSKVPIDMNNLIGIVNKINTNCANGLVENALITEALTIGSSILYVMHLLPSQITNKCVVHLVGASAFEGTTDWTITSELLFHSMPHLTELTYYLIGPEAFNISNLINLCETCNKSAKKVSINVLVHFYHDIVSVIERPDYIFALNSGFCEYENQKQDQWKGSIPFLFLGDIPLAFTSYTEQEARKDFTYIRQTVPDINLFVIEKQKNPFSSWRPIRNWYTRDLSLFYNNAYITILKKI